MKNFNISKDLKKAIAEKKWFNVEKLLLMMDFVIRNEERFLDLFDIRLEIDFHVVEENLFSLDMYFPEQSGLSICGDCIFLFSGQSSDLAEASYDFVRRIESILGEGLDEEKNTYFDSLPELLKKLTALVN